MLLKRLPSPVLKFDELPQIAHIHFINALPQFIAMLTRVNPKEFMDSVEIVSPKNFIFMECRGNKLECSSYANMATSILTDLNRCQNVKFAFDSPNSSLEVCSKVIKPCKLTFNKPTSTPADVNILVMTKYDELATLQSLYRTYKDAHILCLDSSAPIHPEHFPVEKTHCIDQPDLFRATHSGAVLYKKDCGISHLTDYECYKFEKIKDVIHMGVEFCMGEVEEVEMPPFVDWINIQIESARKVKTAQNEALKWAYDITNFNVSRLKIHAKITGEDWRKPIQCLRNCYPILEKIAEHSHTKHALFAQYVLDVLLIRTPDAKRWDTLSHYFMYVALVGNYNSETKKIEPFPGDFYAGVSNDEVAKWLEGLYP